MNSDTDSGFVERIRNSLGTQNGFTLVELMVAATVLMIGLIGTVALLENANRTSAGNIARVGATNLARQVVENLRTVDYEAITPTQLGPALASRGDINTSSTNFPFAVAEKGITYAVNATVCTYDDPKDGVGSTAPQSVCSPQAPASVGAPADANPDDFKRVTVTITWTQGSGSRTVTQTALLANPSGGLGPRMTAFTAPPDNVSQFTSGATANFLATTTSASSVTWTSDGLNGFGNATGGPTSWTAAWSLGSAATPLVAPVVGPQYTANTVLDGVYTVSAQPFDIRGVAGEARTATLSLNRSLPLTVTGFVGGRNQLQDTIDFQWTPNPERDIVGYAVYWAGTDGVIGNADDSRVCPNGGSVGYVTTPYCSDTTPPNGSPQTHYVVAFDRTDLTNSASALRPSPFQAPFIVGAAGTPPSTPTLSSSVTVVDALPTLSWTQPGAIGDVRFFRIYRDGCCSLSDRYDYTASNALSWADQNPNDTQHEYYVTAVNDSFDESAPSNGITWYP